MQLRKEVSIISTSTGQPVDTDSLGEALQLIVMDILREPLRWSKVVRNIVSTSKDQNAILLSAGPVRAADSLLREMTKAGVNVEENTELKPLHASPTQHRSSDIAIVGIAGRLPESETLEEAWRILEDGRDVHKKVSPLQYRLKPQAHTT